MNILTQYYYLLQAVGFKKKNTVETDGNRILILQSAPLGDTALFIKACLTAGPEMDIDIICESAMAPLWRYFFPKALIISHSFNQWQPNKLKAALHPLAKNGYKAILIPTMSKRAAYVSAFVPARMRAGLVGQNVYTGAHYLLDYLCRVKDNEHLQQRYSRLLATVGFSPADKPAPTPSPGNVLTLHPGAKWPHRRWPKERFAELAKQLSQKGYQVQIMIWDQEKDLLNYFQSLNFNENITLTVTCNLQDVIACIEKSRLVIGNDSGPIHLANLMNRQVVCIWGPGNLERIAPQGRQVNLVFKEKECRPCRQYQTMPPCGTSPGQCLRDISVDEVLRQISFL